LDLTGKRVVAIDPGIITVVSGVVYDQQRGWNERSDTFAMSGGEFYHWAGYHLRTRTTSMWEKRGWRDAESEAGASALSARVLCRSG
jgi:hypothetical protein